MLKRRKSCAGRPVAASGDVSGDGEGDDGSPGCSGSQAEWGCRPGTSCCRLALSHDCCPASSYGTPAKTPYFVLACIHFLQL